MYVYVHIYRFPNETWVRYLEVAVGVLNMGWGIAVDI